ncbi:MAG: hypothetical protein ACI4EW_02775 [Butyrivibrio sp.]
MRRSIKKALAAAVALIIAAGSFISSPVIYAADEPEDNVEVLLENEYKYYYKFSNGSVVMATERGDERLTAEDSISIIDSKGNITEISNKNSDGTVKYVRYTGYYNVSGDDFIKYMECLREDGSEAIMSEDLTWIGDGDNRYTYVDQFDNNYYLVNDGTKYNVIDKEEKIVKEDVIENIEYFWGICAEFGGNYCIKRGHMDFTSDLILFDHEFNEKDKIILGGLFDYEVDILGDYLLLIKGNTIICIDSDLNKKEKNINVENSGYYININPDYEEAFEVEVVYHGGYENDKYLLSYDTLEEVSEEECTPIVEESNMSDGNDDIDFVYEDGEGGIYSKDGNAIYTYAQLREYFNTLLELGEGDGLWVYPFAADANRVYIYLSYWTNGGEDRVKCYYALNKDDDYSLDKAELLDTDNVYIGDDWLIFNNEEGSVVRDSEGKVILSTEKIICDYIEETGVFITYAYTDDGRLYGAIRKSTIKESTLSERICSQIETAEENGTVEIDAGVENIVITKDVLVAVKEKNVTLVIKSEGGASWTIKGSDITGTIPEVIDLTVDMVEGVIPQTAIEKVKLEGTVVELSIEHTGDFGFKAEFKLNLGTENSGKYANLFYYNPETGALEFIEGVKIAEDGTAGFKFTHASEYAIIISDSLFTADNKPADNKPSDDDPAAGYNSNIAICIIAMFTMIGAFAVVATKKKVTE